MAAPMKVKKAKSKINSAPVSFTGTIEEAVVAADEKFQSGDLNGACELYQHAAMQQPDNTSILDAFGEVLFELGRDADARQVLERSVSIDPTGNHSKYMILAQISKEQEASTHYQTGTALLQAKLEAAVGEASSSAAIPSHEIRALRRELSNAYCSLAELYMTDLCDEDDAEDQCASFATKALQADESNPDAYNAAANLRMCQKNMEEARQLLRRCLGVMEACYAAVDGEKQQEEDMAGVTSATADNAGSAELPPWESRLHFAKCCSEAELYAEAASTLERLLAEDDSEMEPWFLLGEAFVLDGRPAAGVEVLETADALLCAALVSKGIRVKGAPKVDASALDAHAGALAELRVKTSKELQEMRSRFEELLTYARQQAEEEGDDDEEEDEDEGEGDGDEEEMET